MGTDSLFLLFLHRCKSRSQLGSTSASVTDPPLHSGSCWPQRPWPEHWGTLKYEMIHQNLPKPPEETALLKLSVTRQKWWALAGLYVGSPLSTDLEQQDQPLRLCLHEEHFSGMRSSGCCLAETPSRDTTLLAKLWVHEYKAATLPSAKNTEPVEARFCFGSLHVRTLASSKDTDPPA